MPIVLIKILIALIADQILGEPRKGHPLVAFGNHANRIEARYNNGSEQQRLRNGVIAWCIAVLPWVALATIAHLSPLGFWFDCILLYLAIGRKSLFEHSERVWNALQGSDLQQARHHTGMIVSRDALARAGWPDGIPGRNVLDVHIVRLRRRLAPLGLVIRTVRSRGYLLETGRLEAATGS